MTVTESRPLPTTEKILRAHWLPPEPAGSTVSAGRRAATLLDKVIAALVDELSRLDDTRRRHVRALVDTAGRAGVDAGEVLALVEQIDTATVAARALVQQRLEVARQARTVAGDDVSNGLYRDPDYVAWKRACDNIIRAWRELSALDDTARLDGFIALARRLDDNQPADLAARSGGEDSPPPAVTGTDGKTYPSTSTPLTVERVPTRATFPAPDWDRDPIEG